jgi:hypothetical protein
MSEKNDTINPFDPTGFFKSMRDTNMESWSKMMIQLVNTDAYSQATAKLMDTWLTTSAPFRKLLETVMTQVLTNLNMPTRADVTSIAQRLTNIELRLDDLEARLEGEHRKAAASKPKTAAGESKP